MTAIIWKISLYIKIEKKEEAECNVCKANGEKKYTISTKNFGTAGLITHLKSKHRETEYYKKYEALEKTKQKLEPKGSIDKYVNILSGGGLSALDKKAINWICCTLTSFNAINHPTTRALINKNVEELKDESHYRKVVLPKAYQSVKAKVIKELDACDFISFTTDIWSGLTESFISLTAHVINKIWERKNFILSVSEFPGSHTGDRIHEKVQEMLKAWKIKVEKCHLFLRDGGANFKKAFTDVNLNIHKLDHADCVAHLLNLIVRDSLKHPPVSFLLTKCRKIVGHFKHSNTAVDCFKEIQLEQDIPEHQLLQDMPVRWNAAFLMCQRLNEQRVAIEHYAYQKERLELTLTDSEWEMLAQLVDLLQPLEELTRLFCDSPISVQYPFAVMVQEKLEKMFPSNQEIKTVRNLITQGLKDRFKHLCEDKNHAIAQFLDPRFKDRHMMAPEEFRRKVHNWLKECQDLIIDAGDQGEQVDFIQPPSKRLKSGLLDSFEESMNQNEVPVDSTSSQSQPDLRKEIMEYLIRSREPMKSNPLDFWKKNSKVFPLLSKAARRYLSPPATSVASEGYFLLPVMFILTDECAFDHERQRWLFFLIEIFHFLITNIERHYILLTVFCLSFYGLTLFFENL